MARVVSVDIGCQPSPSGSEELILQSEAGVLVIFLAIDTKPSERGLLEDRGVAVVRCIDCHATRHGYPNDEGRAEHPLWRRGLSEAGGVAEVENSAWAAEVKAQIESARRRLWHPSALLSAPEVEIRHFIFQFAESTLECLASGLSPTLYNVSYAEAVRRALSSVLHESAT